MLKFYNIKNQGDGTARINIHSQIGESWFDDAGITSQKFIDQVDALGDLTEIHLHINSPGGAVSDGIAIFNYLKQHKAKITVTVDALAASIASVIAMAGDTITMALGSVMFVHDPMALAGGNADDMRWTADHLEKIKDSIIDIYANRTSLSRNKISDLMKEETTMTAGEAVEHGFADRTETYDQNMSAFNRTDLRNMVVNLATNKGPDAEVISLRSQLDQANNQIRELMAPPVPASSTDVIAACKTARACAILLTMPGGGG